MFSSTLCRYAEIPEICRGFSGVWLFCAEIPMDLQMDALKLRDPATRSQMRSFVGIPWRVEGSWLSTCLNQSWIQQMILMPVMGYPPSELDANQPDLICDMMEYTYRYQYVPQTDIYRSIHPFIHPFIHSSIHPSIYLSIHLPPKLDIENTHVQSGEVIWFT